MNTIIEEIKNIDISKIDRDTLVDIRDVHIDEGLSSQEERMRDFVQKIKNPYMYKVGKIAVKVRFAETDVTLEDRLESLISKL